MVSWSPVTALTEHIKFNVPSAIGVKFIRVEFLYGYTLSRTNDAWPHYFFYLHLQNTVGGTAWLVRFNYCSAQLLICMSMTRCFRARIISSAKLIDKGGTSNWRKCGHGAVLPGVSSGIVWCVARILNRGALDTHTHALAEVCVSRV